MALKHLSLNEMVHVTASLIHPKDPARAVLASSALLAPLLPLLEQAHQQAVAAMPLPEDPRRAALMAEAIALDTAHDTLAGNVYRLLTALAELGDEGARYLELRDRLLPDGLAGTTNLTHEGEAGLGARIRATLTAEIRAELAAIAAGSRPLLELVDQWLATAERLGVVTQQQRALESAAPGVSPSGINEARLGWIRAVNALKHLSPLAALDEESARTVFSGLDALELKADARAARRRAGSLESDLEREASEESPPAVDVPMASP